MKKFDNLFVKGVIAASIVAGGIGGADVISSRALAPVNDIRPPGFGCARSDGLTYSEAADPNAGIGETGFEWALIQGTTDDPAHQRISGYYEGDDQCYYRIDVDG